MGAWSDVTGGSAVCKNEAAVGQHDICTMTHGTEITVRGDSCGTLAGVDGIDTDGDGTANIATGNVATILCENGVVTIDNNGVVTTFTLGDTLVCV